MLATEGLAVLSEILKVPSFKEESPEATRESLGQVGGQSEALGSLALGYSHLFRLNF